MTDEPTIKFPEDFEMKESPEYNDLVPIYDTTTGKSKKTSLEKIMAQTQASIIGTATPSSSPTGSETNGQSYRVSNKTGAVLQFLNFLTNVSDGSGGFLPISMAANERSGLIVKNPDGWVYNDNTSQADTSELVAKSETSSTVVGKNRFDVSKIVVGAITSAGSLNVGYPNARSIVGLPVVAGENLVISNIVGAKGSYYIAFKDKNGAVAGPVLNMGVFPTSMPAPENAVTVDFTVLGSDGVGDYSDAQIERGLVATEYEAPIIGTDGVVNPIAAQYLTLGANVSDPVLPKNPTTKQYVDDNAIIMNALDNDFTTSNSINTKWTWTQTANNEFMVSDLVGTWDAIGFSGINNLQFTLQHGRLWVLLGYKDANNICALGLTSPGAVNTFFGQIVNIDLTDQTFTVIRSGAIASKPIGTKIKIELDDNVLKVSTNGSLELTIDMSTYPTANMDNVLLGFAGYNASSSIANGSILASDVFYGIVSTVKNELTKLQVRGTNKYDSLKGKRISIIGDSISTGNPIYGGVTTANCWWGLLKSWCGIETYVNAIGGTAIAYSSANESFVTDSRWQSLNSQFEPDVIIVFGGTNDFGARAIPVGDPTDLPSATNPTFYSGVKYLFQNLCARYPTAKIFCMTPLHQSGYGFPETSGGRLFSDYVGVLKELAPLYGINVIDTYSKSGLTYENMKSSLGLYTTDNLHPNAAGHYKIAECVINELVAAFR